MTKRQSVLDAVSVLVGAGAVLVPTHARWNVVEPLSRFVWIAVAVIAPIVAVVSVLSRRQIRWTVASVLLGVSGGVLIDALPDSQRNLFPLEILFWSVYLAPALALGAGGAFVIRRRRAAVQPSGSSGWRSA